MESFSKYLVSIRCRFGMTQQGLADRVGCARSLIARYESGSAVPSVKFCHELAKAFNLDADRLILMSGRLPQADLEEAVQSRLKAYSA